MHNDELDQEVLNHIATWEGAMAAWHADLDPNLIEDDEARRAFKWQMRQIKQHDVPAIDEELTDEFDITFDDPSMDFDDLVAALEERRRCS